MYAPRTDGWARVVRAWPASVRARIEADISAHGLGYPWWIPFVSFASQAVCVLLALAVRDALVPPAPIALTLLLVVAPDLLEFARGRMIPAWVEISMVGTAAAWLLFAPSAQHTGTIDPAPFLLTLLAAEVVARDGLRAGVATALGSLALIVAAAVGPGVYSLPIHLLDVALGAAIGAILLWQMRALEAEREARVGERERATLAERERIAREIHDLVAHSLSVTLLHITGARHALRDADDPSNGGFDAREVDSALADAEQVGRQAMADIRQTVSTLTDGPSATQALPGAADICGLVAQMELAGLHVEYVEDGDPAMLAHGTGLGLYRIAQESLANIAKHAPTATARVRFSVNRRRARLTVRNALTAQHVTGEGGSGIAGMRARAAQLGATVVAGPEDADWVVDVRLPLQQRDGELWCGRKLPRLLR
ncbi:MAG TPA: histidine kinase [Marmoricola sp.]